MFESLVSKKWDRHLRRQSPYDYLVFASSMSFKRFTNAAGSVRLPPSASKA
ncbi:MAG: hypothetical protein JWP59_1427 [Massilia sp.]|nr:hypothetical protein [Massilia sp.]